jgi:hypothetical protein
MHYRDVRGVAVTLTYGELQLSRERPGACSTVRVPASACVLHRWVHAGLGTHACHPNERLTAARAGRISIRFVAKTGNSKTSKLTSGRTGQDVKRKAKDEKRKK